MRRAFLTVVFAALAAGLLTPFARHSKGGVEGTGTLIETNGPFTPLDAALVIRAVARYEPRGIAFLEPLTGNEGRPLLQAKLEDSRVPVTFPTPAPVVTEVRVPRRISFDRLMIVTERSERGEITTELDALFRGRQVVVESAGGQGWRGLAEPAPQVVTVRPFPFAGMLLAASLPWWPLRRRSRALAALGVGNFWLLIGLSVGPVDVPALLAAWILLPLLGWLAPGPGERPV